MTKVHEFDPVIYPRKVWVMVTSDEVFLNDTFDHDCNLHHFAYKTKAIVFPCEMKKTGEYGVAVVFTRKKHFNLKTICHEAVHVASSIFHDCNIKMAFDEGKDEHYAYLIEWVAECLQTVKNYRNSK